MTSMHVRPSWRLYIVFASYRPRAAVIGLHRSISANRFTTFRVWARHRQFVVAAIVTQSTGRSDKVRQKGIEIPWLVTALLSVRSRVCCSTVGNTNRPRLGLYYPKWYVCDIGWFLRSSILSIFSRRLAQYTFFVPAFDYILMWI